MSVLISRELLINYDNATTYLTANNTLSLPYNSNGYQTAIGIISSSSLASASATLNSAAMDILFPSDNAIPQEAELGVLDAKKNNGTVEEANSAYISINDTEYTKTILTNNPSSSYEKVQGGLTSKNNTSINCFLTKDNSKTGGGSGVSVGSNYYLKLTFKQVSCYGVALAAGIGSITVSNYTPYVGDSVTFTANLVNDDVVFYGWSTVMDGSQIISQDLSYTCSPTDDLILYAVSSFSTPITTNYETLEGHTAYLYDSNFETYWRSNDNQSAGKYIECMFHQPIFFIALQVESIVNPSECLSDKNIFQITRDNGVTWETVARFTGQPSCTIAGVHKENVNGVRIYAEEDSDTKLSINEIMFYHTIERPVCNVIKAVYKKIDGNWVEMTDMLSLFE